MTCDFDVHYVSVSELGFMIHVLFTQGSPITNSDYQCTIYRRLSRFWYKILEYMYTVLQQDTSIATTFINMKLTLVFLLCGLCFFSSFNAKPMCKFIPTTDHKNEQIVVNLFQCLVDILNLSTRIPPEMELLAFGNQLWRSCILLYYPKTTNVTCFASFVWPKNLA